MFNENGAFNTFAFKCSLLLKNIKTYEKNSTSMEFGSTKYSIIFFEKVRIREEK